MEKKLERMFVVTEIKILSAIENEPGISYVELLNIGLKEKSADSVFDKKLISALINSGYVRANCHDLSSSLLHLTPSGATRLCQLKEISAKYRTEQRHWWITTIIAAIALILSLISLLLQSGLLQSLLQKA